MINKARLGMRSGLGTPSFGGFHWFGLLTLGVFFVLRADSLFHTCAKAATMNAGSSEYKKKKKIICMKSELYILLLLFFCLFILHEFFFYCHVFYFLYVRRLPVLHSGSSGIHSRDADLRQTLGL